jgi:hypothetical protein
VAEILGMVGGIACVYSSRRRRSEMSTNFCESPLIMNPLYTIMPQIDDDSSSASHFRGSVVYWREVYFRGQPKG